MKKLALFFVATLCAPLALAYASASASTQRLIQEIRRDRKQAIQMASSLEFRPNRSPLRQGEAFTVFILPKFTFDNAEMELVARLDGVDKGLLKASANTWMLQAGPFSRIQEHNLEVTVYIRNAVLAKKVRDSLAAVNQQITNLRVQIANTRDPQTRAMLEQQLSDKLTEKDVLIQEYAALKKALAVESYTFQVAEAVNNPNFPSITSIDPVTGLVSGGTFVTVSGANFSAPATVKVGGISASNVDVVNSSTLNFISPAFDQVGLKDVEIILPANSAGGEERNALLRNAFYAGEPAPVQNLKPVAVVSGGHLIKAFGEEVQLDGSASYDPNTPPASLSFAWKVIASPADSNLPQGAMLDPISRPQFTPSKSGFYVFELQVTETDTPELLSSDSTLATLEVLAPPVNHPPVPNAPAILVDQGATATSQVSHGDPDSGDSFTYSITMNPAHGTASVDEEGLVTFTADSNYAGSDSLEVTVTDQGGLFASVEIPITIESTNNAPTASAPAITVTAGETATSQISVSDDEGQLHSYAIQSAASKGTASVDESGLVSFTANSGESGSDSVTIRITDNGVPALFVDLVIDITINAPANQAPAPTAPNITVTAGQSATSQVTPNNPEAGQTVQYSILTQGTKGTASVNSSGLATYTANGNASGSDSFTVRVLDDGVPPLTGDVTIQVTINEAPNNPPNPGTPFYWINTKGSPVNVSLGLQNPSDDGSIVSVRHNFGDGTPELVVTMGPFYLATHDYKVAGTYTVTSVLTDDEGAETTVTQTVNAVDVNIPSAKFTANFVGTAPHAVNFDATAATGNITNYRWLYGDNSPEAVGSALVTPTHQYLNNGVYTVRFRTRDPNRAQGQAFARVYVGQNPPAYGQVPTADFQPNKRRVLVNETMQLDGLRSFDPDSVNGALLYDWQFGLGSPASANIASPSVIFNLPLNHVITLLVDDGIGGTGLKQMEVFSVNQGVEPTPILQADVISGVAPLTVNFNGAASYDTDGVVVEHHWIPVVGDPSPPIAGAQLTHVYDTPGAYVASLEVTDDHGNKVRANQTISVLMPGKSLPKRTELSEEEKEERRLLLGGCVSGSAYSCFVLGEKYLGDGDSFTANGFFEKACSLGYQPACGQ